MRDEMKSQGYSKEDEYFHRKDQELIAKLREKAEAERAKLEAENQKNAYWMRCPKCGSAMVEQKYGRGPGRPVHFEVLRWNLLRRRRA